MSISQLPIIAQLIDIFAAVMNLVYDIFDNLGIHNAIVYIIVFAILSRLLMLPATISNHKKIRANAVLEPVNKELKDKYKKLDKKIFQNKMLFERFVLSNKYDTGKNSGCMNFFIQFPILVAIYYVVGHLSEFVPEIAEMTDTQLTSLYAFNNLDIRDVPGTTLLAVFPICTVVIQLLHGITMDLMNRRKIDASNLFSNFLTAYLGFKFPTFLSIYWLTQNIFSFIFSLILTLYFNTKNEQYFIDSKLNKVNKVRIKKGLKPLMEPIDIVHEDAEETALYEKELGINIVNLNDAEKKILEVEEEEEEKEKGEGIDVEKALNDIIEKDFKENEQKESE